MRFRIRIVRLLVLVALAAPAHAQQFPSKSVCLVNPFPPGGLLAPAGTPRDIVARINADAVKALRDEKAAAARSNDLREAIASTSLRIASEEIRLTASFGVATFPIDGKSARALLKKADLALYRAKARGRDTVST